MVKIRYSELPSGLHVRAMKHGRHAIIYLKPGLTPAERHAALIRVRSGSRMGLGPQLHALGMAVAIGADWIGTTTRHGVAAVRRHRVLLIPPLVLLVSAAIVFVLMSLVTLTQAPSRVAGTDPVSVPARAGSHWRQAALRAHGRATRPAGRAARPATATADLRRAPGQPVPLPPRPSSRQVRDPQGQWAGGGHRRPPRPHRRAPNPPRPRPHRQGRASG